MTRKTMPEYERTDEVLEFIQDYISSNLYPPTIREIGDGCDISSTSVVVYHLDKLEKYGFIERKRNRASSIRIIGND
ncbi:MAG: LexA family protein [Candidatus Thorarchaeota archaeon]|jgi:repressor LexA